MQSQPKPVSRSNRHQAPRRLHTPRWPWGDYRASDGSLNTFAADINNAGHVVGSTSVPGFDSGHYSQPFLLNPQDTNGDGQPEIWFVDEVQNTTGARGPDGQNDLIIGLGNLPGAIHGQAREVNDLGIVVGYSYYWNEATSEYRYQAFVVVPAGHSWHQDEDLDGVNDLMT